MIYVYSQIGYYVVIFFHILQVIKKAAKGGSNNLKLKKIY
ncbi:MAG: hypothetical protein Rpha_1218 [Candidatus Ruthia sp. Apha_13_S6]|nr:hypothetical protein [Candidatus Ruthia sp. Apha_13_S6]